MNKRFFTYALLVSAALATAGCARSGRQVWADAKTATKQIGQGFRSLWGASEKKKTGQYAAREDFFSVIDEEYSSIDESDISAASQIQEIPQPAISPGEKGGPIPGIDSFSAPRGSLVGVFQRIHFPYDSNRITGDQNQTVLKRIASHLKSNPHTYIFVEGHCDQRGTGEYNLALGTRRANAVRAYLVKQGANADQIFTISMGKERPLKLGDNEAAWRENRRSEFKIYNR